MILSNQQYKRIGVTHTAEARLLAREEKISILGTYFEQSDRIVEAVSTISSKELGDVDTVINRLARIDLAVDSFNDEIDPNLLDGQLNMVELAFNQTPDYGKAAGLNAIRTQSDSNDAMQRALNQAKKANTKKSEGQVLKDATAKELRNPKVPYTLTPDEQRAAALTKDRPFDALQDEIEALANREWDPDALARLEYIRTQMSEQAAKGQLDFVINMMRDDLGVRTASAISAGNTLREPLPEWKISSKIWTPERRDDIYKSVIRDVKNNTPKNDIVRRLEDYLKSTGQGKAFYKADRLVDTELHRAYTRGAATSTRVWNEKALLKLLYRRSLSPSHSVPDICDDLKGTYDPSKGGVPDVPSHPWCTCLINRVFEADNQAKIKDLGSQGTLYTSDKFGTEAVLY